MNRIIDSKVICPELFRTTIGGHTAEIMSTFFEKRFFSEFAQNVIFKEAEDAFKNQIDDETPAGIWQGEFWGKLMLSAAEIYKYTGNAKFKKFLVESCMRVISYGREDGYIGSYKDSKNVFAQQETPDGPCWCWNVWCRKYTLWGLIATYEITGNETILTAAKRMADQLIDEFRECGIEITKTGTFCGMPSCSILKPMVLLYEHTGDKKYLDFCITDITDKWESAENICPNLITNSLSGKPISEWYPDSHLWAKAYEMMSCVEGICELYRATGTKKYLDTAVSFFDIITKYEKNLIGSVAYNDMFADARNSINAMSEPCDSIHYMRLCYELYVLSGDIKYIHLFETCYFNAFMAGMFRNGEWSARAVRSAGRHMWTKQAKTQYQHCCLNNMGRGFLRYADIAVVMLDGDIVINLFEQFNAKLKLDNGSCNINISEGYLEGKPVKISAEFEGAPKKLRIRIPDWCTSSFENAGTIKDGYLEIMPKTSYTEICLDFEIKPQVKMFHTEPNDNSWNLERWQSTYAKDSATPEDLFVHEKRCTLWYGPMLLAKSKKIGCTEDQLFEKAVNKGAECTLKPLPSDSAYVTFEATFKNPDGSTFTSKVCDFASAADSILEDDRYHCIFF